MFIAVLLGSHLLAACSAGSGDGSAAGAGHEEAQGSDFGDAVSLVGAVRPAGGVGLPGIDRDAGVSVALPDGSVVWFFGDTAQRNPDGSLEFFEVGSAAWAPAGEPLATLDHVASGRVVPFAQPTGDFPPCPARAPRAGMWPLSAVADPTDDNRVVIWMANVCLGPDRTLLDHGISVGEWTYDPERPPDGSPVEVEVLNQNLFPHAEFGDAAVAVGSQIVVYGCAPPDSAGVVITDAGECTAARVRPSSVSEPSAYEVWSGSGWSRGGGSVAMEMPLDGAGTASPPGPVAIAQMPGGRGYAMVYTPWPGFAPWFDLRVADSPTGPWSVPHRVRLEDCGPGVDAVEACYGANTQPFLSDEEHLGVGYYDRSVAAPRSGGAFMVGLVDIGSA